MVGDTKVQGALLDESLGGLLNKIPGFRFATQTLTNPFMLQRYYEGHKQKVDALGALATPDGALEAANKELLGTPEMPGLLEQHTACETLGEIKELQLLMVEKRLAGLEGQTFDPTKDARMIGLAENFQKNIGPDGKPLIEGLDGNALLKAMYDDITKLDENGLKKLGMKAEGELGAIKAFGKQVRASKEFYEEIKENPQEFIKNAKKNIKDHLKNMGELGNKTTAFSQGLANFYKDGDSSLLIPIINPNSRFAQQSAEKFDMNNLNNLGGPTNRSDDAPPEKEEQVELLYDIEQDSQVGYVEYKSKHVTERHDVFKDNETDQFYRKGINGEQVAVKEEDIHFRANEKQMILGEATQQVEIISGPNQGKSVEQSFTIDLAEGDKDMKDIHSEIVRLHKEGKLTRDDMKEYSAVLGNRANPDSPIGAREAFREYHREYMKNPQPCAREGLHVIGRVQNNDAKYKEITSKLMAKGKANGAETTMLETLIATFGAVKSRDDDGAR